MSSEYPGARRLTWILAIGMVFITGAWLRFHALDQVELFVDEGGHLLVPVDEDIRRVIDPVAEGKPGMLWFFRPAFALGGDPLIAARAMIGVCGLLTATSIGVTLWLLFGPMAGILGSALWLLLPFTVFHERLALFDPVVATLVAGGIALTAYGNSSRRSARHSLAWTLLGSLIAGTAALQKISALVLAPWLIVIFLAIQRRCGRSSGRGQLLAVIGMFVLPALLFWLMAPGFGERVFKSNPAAVRSAPFSFVSWYAGYGGCALIILIIYAIVAIWRRKERVIAWFGIAALLSLVVSSVVYRRPYARYVHPDHIPLVMFIAAAIGSDPRRLGLTLAAVACIRWGYIDLRVISDPKTAPLPADEIEQYVTGFWSGSGSNRTVYFIEQHTPCLIFVHRYARPASYAILLAARRNPSITVVPLSLEAPGALRVVKAVTETKRPVRSDGGAVYVLAEGMPPFEPMALTAAGIPYDIVYETMKPDPIGRAQVLECHFARSAEL